MPGLLYCAAAKSLLLQLQTQVNHMAVVTADHKGAVLTINIRVYLETVLLNKQEVIHEYVYT